MDRWTTASDHRRRGSARALAAVSAALVLAACYEPQPRSFTEFMEDRLAREGTIAICNRDPIASRTDIECANARRAEAAIALRMERERREEFERESERRLESLRREMAERERIARESALAAARAEREAYEAIWRGAAGNNAAAPNAPAANGANSSAVTGQVGPLPD